MILRDMIHTNQTLQAGVQDLPVFEHLISGGDQILESLICPQRVTHTDPLPQFERQYVSSHHFHTSSACSSMHFAVFLCHPPIC